jgi:hypothetical protein
MGFCKYFILMIHASGADIFLKIERRRCRRFRAAIYPAGSSRELRLCYDFTNLFHSNRKSTTASHDLGKAHT